MKTTDHFWKTRLWEPDRAHIQLAWIQMAVDQPVKREVQPDGRIRCWVAVPQLGGRFLRVVLLADGETVHTAFVDGRFRP